MSVITEAQEFIAREGGKKSAGTVARHARVRRRQLIASINHDIPEATATVNCGNCTACCRAGRPVNLVAEDDPTGLDTVEKDGELFIRQNAGGSCVHLVDNKCSVREHRPMACRVYDCRDHVMCGVLPKQPLMAQACRQWYPEFKSNADVYVLIRLRDKAQALLTSAPGDISARTAAHTVLLTDGGSL